MLMDPHRLTNGSGHSLASRLLVALVTFALVISTFPCSAAVSLADEGDIQTADAEAQVTQDAADNGAQVTQEVQADQADQAAAETQGAAADGTQVADAETQVAQDAAETTSQGAQEAEEAQAVAADATQTTVPDAAQPADVQPQDAADAEAGLAQIAYEDDDLVATVTEATPGALPEGASLAVRELTPTSDAVQEGLKGSDQEANAAQADIDAYVDAVSKVSEEAQADGKSLVSARAYDIQLLDAQGNEIEPQGQVKVSLTYKKKAELESAKPDSSNVEVAHVQDNGQVESVAAQIDSDAAGRIESADFHADSFSVYVIFDTNKTSTTEPTNMGTYGWIRFGGDVQKADSLPATPGFDNAGWMRYLKINIYTLNRGADPSNFNSYTYQKSFEHLATWSDSFTVESSQLGGTVKMTGFRKAGESAWQQYSGLETSYAANQFYQTWSPSGFSGDENELNIYLDTSGGGFDSSV